MKVLTMRASEWRAVMTVAVTILLTVLAPTVLAGGQSRVVVTVQELIQRGHRIEVPVGTEVVWVDPHFDRVWFPPRSDAPAVKRTEQGFRALFSKRGTYRGAFTIAGGHGSTDVYPVIVTVRER